MGSGIYGSGVGTGVGVAVGAGVDVGLVVGAAVGINVGANKDAADRIADYATGVTAMAPLADYLDTVAALNPDGTLRYYPGSPEIARRLSRAQDRVLLNEKHPEDGQLLKANMAGDRRVTVHLGEGWHLAKALLPVAEKRALLLIDPPFEQADELARCAESLATAIARMRQTVVAIWYPIKDVRQLRPFYQALQQSGAPKLLRAELWVHPTDNPAGLNGSGLAIANPPWPLEDELRELLPWLAAQLAQSQGGWRLDWLIEEKAAG